MKRKTKRTGSGGRLRLGLLLATAAAFLLVPAVQASAEPKLKVNIISQPGASGEVLSDAATPFKGTPSIACNYPVGGPQEGVCENEMTPVKNEFGETVRWQVALTTKAGPGSKIWKWEFITGQKHALCGKGQVGCTVKTLKESEDAQINVYFQNEVPELRVKLIGQEGGGGEVVSPNILISLPGTPPLECWLPEGGAQQGVCENKLEEIGPGEFGESLEALAHSAAHPAPNSKFVKWEFKSGVCLPAPEQCGEFPRAIGASSGEDVEVNAVFACEAGKECPPPPEEFPLNLTTSGSGSGAFECDTGSGPGPCAPKYKEGTKVTVIPKAATGSKFVAFSGDCTGGSCEVTMSGAKSVDGQFDLESFTFTVETTGEGSVQCQVNGGPLGACPPSALYGDEIDVKASPGEGDTLKSLTGTGSAAGTCNAETGACSFAITKHSGVSATFVPANIIDIVEENVHGEVPETTELTSDCEGDVDLGIFKPGLTHDYTGTCILTVTSTGEKTSLTASDGGIDSGYLTQKPLHPYSLPKLLKTQITATEGLGGEIKGIGTLETPFTLLAYPKPVSADHATLEFTQPIGNHDSLHTGVYAKMITLTLEQTTP